MADFNQSMEKAVCIDEEIFFGPITNKEMKIRQFFENPNKNYKSSIESSQMVENDISRNDSLYKSFSVEDSKYDSFEDSLNEEIDEKPSITKHVTLRKSFDKLKAKKHAFYDSLEDVCSLVSNIDKCSISCDIEKQHIVDDSLQIPHVVVTNKSQGISDQIHFDEDSLAIAEFENTFDDSLEEINMISSIEIEDVNDLEDIEEENLNICSNVNQKHDFVSRNLFEASVEIICEKKKIKAELDEPFNSENKQFDLLSNSECKDILKDSLEESDKSISKFNFGHKSIEQTSFMKDLNVVETKEKNELDSSVRILYEKLGNSSDGEFISCSECYDLSKDSLEKSKTVDSLSLCEQNSCKEELNNAEYKVKSELDESVQIIFEKMGSSSDAKYISYSECYDVSNGSLEKSKNVDHWSHVETATNNIDIKEPDASKFATSASEKIELVDKDALDSSVQILYEKNSTCIETVSIFDCTTVSNDNFENVKCDDHSFIQTALSSHSSNSKELSPMTVDVMTLDKNINTVTPQKIPATCANILVCNSNINKTSKALKDNSVVTDDISRSTKDSSVTIDGIPNFTKDNLYSKKEVITIDADQLKYLNDNLNLDRDMKFELQIEVTVGDKKCKIASENIKIIPVITPVACENAVLPTDCVETNIVNEIKSMEPLIMKSKLSNNGSMKNVQVNKRNSLENIPNEANITQRSKESLKDSQINLNDTSLLQALDLHDISLFNESVIQSKDSVMPLNLCSRDQTAYKLYSSVPRDESKENFPDICLSRNQYVSKQTSCASQAKVSPRNINNENKTPKSLKNTSNSRENSAKRTPGTKIPVMQKLHKIDSFALPVSSAHKVKPVLISTEKEKKCLLSPHSTDSAKTPASSAKKHHFCKVRNTIFSKVPQIVPSKKFVNVESPVAKYIRNEGGTPTKSLMLDPVLRDCVNDLHFHQQFESPYQPHTLPKAGASKLMKRK